LQEHLNLKEEPRKPFNPCKQGNLLWSTLVSFVNNSKQNADLSEIPGIGADPKISEGRKLMEGDDKVDNTKELIDYIFLPLFIKERDTDYTHCNRFCHWLERKGVGGSRHMIVTAIFLRTCKLMFDGSLGEDYKPLHATSPAEHVLPSLDDVGEQPQSASSPVATTGSFSFGGGVPASQPASFFSSGGNAADKPKKPEISATAFGSFSTGPQLAPPSFPAVPGSNLNTGTSGQISCEFSKQLQSVDFTVKRLLNDQQVCGYLEQANESLFSIDDVREVLSENSEVWRRLSQLLSYYCKPSPNSKNTLQNGKVAVFPGGTACTIGDRDLQNFLLALSATLQLDEMQAAHCFSAFRGQYYAGKAGTFCPSEFHNILLLTQVRDFYFTQRLYLLRALQELLRIDQDPEHCYHDSIKKPLDLLVTYTDAQALQILEQLKKAVSPIQLSLQDGCISNHVPCSQREEQHFFSETRRAWGQQQLVEAGELLNCLILLLYTRVTPTGNILHGVLMVSQDIFCLQLKDDRVCSLAAVLVVESLQLWRLLEKDEDSMDAHPLLKEVHNLKQLFDRVMADADQKFEGGDTVIFQTTAMLSWGLLMFLCDSDPLAKAAAKDIVMRANDLGVFSVLEFIAQNLLRHDEHPLSSLADDSVDAMNPECDVAKEQSIWSTTADQVAYASILREMLSCVVLAFYVVEDSISFEPQGEELLMLVSLMANIYKGQVGLCQTFWGCWMECCEDESVFSEPLCILLKKALFYFTCQPLPLLQLASSLSADVESAQQSFALFDDWRSPNKALLVPLQNLPLKDRSGQPLSNNFMNEADVYLAQSCQYVPMGIELIAGMKGSIFQTVGDIFVCFASRYSALAVLIHRLELFCAEAQANESAAEIVCAILDLFTAWFKLVPCLPNVLQKHLYDWKLYQAVKNNGLDSDSVQNLCFKIHPFWLSQMSDDDLQNQYGLTDYSTRQALRSQPLLSSCITRSFCLSFPELIVSIIARQLTKFPLGQNDKSRELLERLLVKSLNLTGALCNGAAPWPAGVLSACLRKFTSENEGFLSRILQTITTLELPNGRYPIALASLSMFTTLVSHILAPGAAAAADLHFVFALFDVNRDGEISIGDLLAAFLGMELQLSLRVVQVALMFSRRNTYTINYQEFVALAKWAETADGETKDEKEFVWATRMCLKESRATQERALGLCQQMLDFGRTILVWSESWTFKVAEERWKVSLGSLKLLRSAFASPLKNRKQELKYALHLSALTQILTEAQVCNRILSLTVMLASSAMESALSDVMVGVVRRMDELRFSGMTKKKDSVAEGLPVDFNKGALGILQADELGSILLIVHEGLRLWECVLEDCLELGPAHHLTAAAVSVLRSHARAPRGLLKIVGSLSSHSISSSVECTYATAITAHLTLPKTSHGSVHLPELVELAAQLMSLALRCSPEDSAVPLLEAAGAKSVGNISEHIVSDICNQSGAPLSMRCALINFIISAVVSNQTSLASNLLLGNMLCVSEMPTGPPLFRINKLLSLDLCYDTPELAAKILQLFQMLWMLPVQSRLGMEISTLSNTENFWGTLCHLLTVNIFDTEKDENEHSLHCYHLLIHAFILQILAIEQHEFMKDASNGSKEINSFLEKEAGKSYEDWVAAYLRFDYDPLLIMKAKDVTLKAGLSLEELKVPTSKQKLGDHYEYNLPVLKKYLANGQVNESTQEFLAVLDAVTAANRCLSLGESQAQLIQSWRIFMEVCIFRRQPGSIAMTDSSQTFSSPDRSTRASFSESWTPKLGSLQSPSFSAPVVSEFKGDIRSSTLAPIVGKFLSVERYQCLEVAEVCREMCDLLLSMVHHQCYKVLQKTTDPGHTITEPRGIAPRGSGHLKPEKMILLLSDVELAWTRIIKPFESDVPLSLKTHIQLRLLTTALLLLRGLKQKSKNGVEALGEHSAADQLCTSFFAHACDTLSSLKLDSTPNGNTCNVQEEKLVQVSISMLDFLVDAQQHVQRVSGANWLALLKKNDVMNAIVRWLAFWSQKNSVYFTTAHSSQHLAQPNFKANELGGQHQNHISKEISSQIENYSSKLQVVLSFLVTCAHSDLIASELVCSDICHELTKNPLFMAMMGVLTNLPPSLAHVRGYQADGKRSNYYCCWDQVIVLVQGLWETLGFQYENAMYQPEDPHTQLCSKAANHCVDFVLHFQALLCAPLSSKKWTLASLNEAATVLYLLSSMAHFLSAHFPAQFCHILALGKGLIRNLALILGDGKNGYHERISHSEYLHHTCIAVSEEEHSSDILDSNQRWKREGDSDVYGNRGIGSSTSKSLRTSRLQYHSNYASRMTPTTPTKDQGDATTSPSRKVFNNRENDSRQSTFKRQLVSAKEFNILFFHQVEHSVSQVLVPLVQLLRFSTPAPDQCVMFTPEEACKVRLPPGTKVLVEGPTGAEMRGIVLSFAPSGYTVQFRDTALEGIRPTQILGAREDSGNEESLFEYRSLSNIYYPPDLMNPEHSLQIPPSIGHLLLLCKCMVSRLIDIEAEEVISSEDTKFLAENLLYLCVTNLLHYKDWVATTSMVDDFNQSEMEHCLLDQLKLMEKYQGVPEEKNDSPANDLDFLKYLMELASKLFWGQEQNLNQETSSSDAFGQINGHSMRLKLMEYSQDNTTTSQSYPSRIFNTAKQKSPNQRLTFAPQEERKNIVQRNHLMKGVRAQDRIVGYEYFSANS